MSDVVRTEQRSILTEMAHKYGMEKAAFESTLKKTIMPANVEATNEQIAAFLVVAKQYDLNPFIKEIYAFPKKGGGIQSIVPIDGWITLANRHPQYDGVNFIDDEDDQGRLVSITCEIFRKDRAYPARVTEYLKECYRDTEQWKTMERRMLRHKAFIQCARYAFGFAGIVDPDEAERERLMEAVPQAQVASQQRLNQIRESLESQAKREEGEIGAA